ncbi:MAG: helix-turn-helix domain-containing protein, partial [Nonomuraea sp.]|nr:helix-turn-helix domain-containing protein [Nonomuraea sp.]
MTDLFGVAVRGRRIESGLTQHDLALLTEVSVRTIRAIERGRVSRPHHRTAAALASALGLARDRPSPAVEPHRGLEVRVLGPLEVVRDGRVIEVGAPMQRCLLGLLALKAGRVARMEEIAETLWGQRPPARWTNLVHTYVARLRRATGSPDAIVAGLGGYRLRTDLVRLDLSRFEDHVSRGLALTRAEEQASRGLASVPFDERVARGLERHRGDAGQEAFALLGAALGLWRGGPLEDLPAHLRDQLTPLSVAIEERYVAAALAYSDVATASGDHDRAISVLTGLSRSRPLHEGLQARLMIALALAGRQADALDVYASIRRRLRQELGVDPGQEIRDAHLRVLRQNLPVRVRVSASYELPADTAAFCGRTAQADRLVEELSRADGPRVVVTGGAGTGKSALAIHVAHRVATRYPDGQLYVDLRGTRLDAEPMTALEALARMSRSLGAPDAAIPADADEAAARFRSLADGRRLLIVLDNACGPDVVRSLLPGSPTCGVLITSRRTLAPVGAAPFELEALSEPDALTLLAHLIGESRVSDERHAAEELVRLCDHLPLAVRVAAARLSARPAWPVGHLAAKLRDERYRLRELAVDGWEVRASLLAGYRDLLRVEGPEAARLFRLLGHLTGPDMTPTTAAALTATAQARPAAGAGADAGADAGA